MKNVNEISWRIVKTKTIKNVAEQDGKPIVERLPNGKFDVLCYGNDGNCKGCKYHKANVLNSCIALCQDNHHIHWIHYKDVSSLKGTRIKQASEFDKLITCSGKAFIIMPDPGSNFNYSIQEILP